MAKYMGWSRYGRPFSKGEFNNSNLKGTFRGSYANYLQEFARQYKKPSLRKYL